MFKDRKKTKYICEYCGREFWGYVSDARRFCSATCANRSRTLNKEDKQQRTCAGCRKCEYSGWDNTLGIHCCYMEITGHMRPDRNDECEIWKTHPRKRGKAPTGKKI